MNKLSTILVFISTFAVFGSCILFDYDKASDDLNPQEQASVRLEADSLYQLGKRSRELSNFKEALRYQTQALALSERLNDTLRIIDDLNQLGTTMRRVGIMERALSYHYQALAYINAYREDTSAVMRRHYQITCNGIGNVHLTLGNDKMAEEYFRKSLEGDLALQNHRGMAINYSNIGSIFERQDRLDSAEYYYQLSLEENQHINSLMGIGLCHTHFGDIHQKLYRLEEAEKEYRKAAIIMSSLRDDYHNLVPLLALTENLTMQGRLQEARLYADTSLIVAERIHAYRSLYEAYANKARMLEKMGDTRGALEYYKQSSVWKDSLYHPAADNSISEVCLQFEQEESLRQMQKLREAYETEDVIHQAVTWIEFSLIIVALIILSLVHYASSSRSKRIKAMDNLANMKEAFFRNFTSGFHAPIEDMIKAANRLKTNGLEEDKDVDLIEKNGMQVLKQVDAVVELSKFAGGEEMPCEYTHSNIVPFLREIVAMHQMLAEEKEVKLVLDVRAPMIVMDYSPVYMQKIVSNLLTAAINGSSQKGGFVSMTVMVRENHLVMVGTDTGDNLTAEDRQHAFELFYQSKTPRLQGSSGLSLPYVYHLVHRLGGIINIKDNEPCGIKIEMVLAMKHMS